jgi:uncharacterized protein YxjI
MQKILNENLIRMSLLVIIRISDDHNNEVLAIIDGNRLAKGDTFELTNAQYKLMSAYGLHEMKKQTKI